MPTTTPTHSDKPIILPPVETLAPLKTSICDQSDIRTAIIEEKLRPVTRRICHLVINNCTFNSYFQTGFTFKTNTFPILHTLALTKSNFTAHQIVTLLLATVKLKTLNLTGWQQHTPLTALNVQPEFLPELGVLNLNNAKVDVSFLRMILMAAPKLVILKIGNTQFFCNDDKVNANVEAVYCLEEFARRGNRAAEITLAQLYELGFYDAIDRNLVFAHYWYERAHLKSECDRIQEKIDKEFIEAHVDINQNSREKLFTELLAKCDAGDRTAANELAYCFQHGIVMPKDPGMAMVLTKLSGDHEWEQVLASSYRTKLQESTKLYHYNSIREREEATNPINTQYARSLSVSYESGVTVPKHDGMAFLYAKIAGDVARANDLLQQYLLTFKFASEIEFVFYRHQHHAFIVNLKKEAENPLNFTQRGKLTASLLSGLYEYGVIVKRNLLYANFWSENRGDERRTRALSKKIRDEWNQSTNHPRDHSPKRK